LIDTDQPNPIVGLIGWSSGTAARKEKIKSRRGRRPARGWLFRAWGLQVFASFYRKAVPHQA
jgi:hypothetical protein